MIVYLVIEGWDDNLRIHGVFSTKENAEAFLKIYFSVENETSYDGPWIKELSLDPYKELYGKHIYSVTIAKDGSSHCTPVTEINEHPAKAWRDHKNNIGMYVVSVSEQEAVKHAESVWLKLIEENRWDKGDLY